MNKVYMPTLSKVQQEGKEEMRSGEAVICYRIVKSRNNGLWTVLEENHLTASE